MSRVIVTGGDDYRLRVWDAKTGRLKSTLAGHTGEVMETAVNYCDTIVASSATDKTVRLWKVSDEDQQSHPLTALQFTAEVHFMAFSPSQHHEQVFITVTCDGGIFIWDLATVTRDNAGEVLTAYCKYYLDVDCKLIRGFDTFSGPKAQSPIEPSGSILEGDHRGYLNFWFAVGCSDKCVRVFSVQPHGDRPVKMDARNPELVKYHHLEFELSGVHTQVVSHICFDNLSGDCASSDDHGGLVLWRLSSSTMYTRPRQKWIEALRLSTPLNPLPEYIELVRPIIPTGDSLVRTYINGEITSCNLSKACPSVRGYWGHHAIRTFSWTADDRYIVCGVAENPVEDSKDETPTVPTEGREYRYGALVFEASSARLVDAVIHPSLVNGEVYVALPAKFVSPCIFCLCSYDGGVTLWRIDAEKGAQVINKFDLSNCHSDDSHSSRQFCDGQFDGRGDFVVTDNLGCVHYFSTAQLRSSMNGVDTLLQEQFFEGDYFLGVHCTAPGERLCDAYMRPYPKSFYTGAARPTSKLKRGRSKSVYLRGLPTRGEGYTIPLAQPISIDDGVDGRDGPPAVEDGFATPMRHSQEAAAHSGVNDDSAIIEPAPRGMMTRSGRTVHRPPIYEEYDSDYTDEVSEDSGPTIEEGSAGPRRRLIHGLPSVHTVAFNADIPPNASCELCHSSGPSTCVGELLGPFAEFSEDCLQAFPHLPLLRHSNTASSVYIHSACLVAADGVRVEVKETPQVTGGAPRRVLVVEDLKRVLRRAGRTICHVCGNSGASVICGSRLSCRGASAHLGCLRSDESLKERQKMDKLIDGIYRCNACLPLDHPRSVRITNDVLKKYIDPAWRGLKCLREWLLVTGHNPNTDTYVPQVGDAVRYFPPERPDLLLTNDDVDPFCWCAGVADRHAPVDCRISTSPPPSYLFPGEQDQRRIAAAECKSINPIDIAAFGNLVMVRLTMEVLSPHPAAGKRFTLHYRPSDGDADLLVPIPRMKAALDYWRARPPHEGSQARIKYDENFSTVEIVDYNEEINEEEEVSILAAGQQEDQARSEEGETATTSSWTVTVPGLMGWKNMNVRDVINTEPGDNSSSSSSSSQVDDESDRKPFAVCAWELVPPRRDTSPFDDEEENGSIDGYHAEVDGSSWRWPWCLTPEEEEVADISDESDPFLAAGPCTYPATPSKARSDLILAWFERLREAPLPKGHWLLQSNRPTEGPQTTIPLPEPDALQRVCLLIHESPFDSADYPRDFLVDNAYPMWTGLIEQRLQRRRYYRGVEPLQEDLRLLARCHRYSPSEVRMGAQCVVGGLLRLCSLTDRELTRRSYQPPSTTTEEPSAALENEMTNPPTRKRTLRIRRSSSSASVNRSSPAKDNWIQCSKCSKWRRVILSIYQRYQGETQFECSDLEGVTCADPPDGALGADNEVLGREDAAIGWVQCDSCSKWRIVDHAVYERFESNPFLKFGCRANGRSCEETSDDIVRGDDNDVDEQEEDSAPTKRAALCRSRIDEFDCHASCEYLREVAVQISRICFQITPEMASTSSARPSVEDALADKSLCADDATLCGKSFSKERLAWYLYGAGFTPIGGVALAVFIPLLLSNLALDQAYSGAAVRSCSSYDGVSCNDDYCYIDQSPSAGLTLTDCTHCIQGEGLKLWDTSLQEFVGWSPP
ncbi:hypothetical protein FOZ61_002968, partial [Perkinsus olseni]